MNKRTFAVAGLLVAGVALAAWGVCREVFAGAPPHPAIDVELAIELGQHELYTTVEPSVVVRNQGRQPLLIQNITTTCGCLGVHVQSEGQAKERIESLQIAPLGSAKLFLPFTVGRSPGQPFVHKVRFATNDPQNPTVEISVGVTPIARYFAVPDQVVVGTMPVGGRADREVEIRAFDRQLPAIVRVTSSNDQVRVSYQPVAPSSEPQGGPEPSELVGKVQVSFEAPATESDIQGEISVFCEGRIEPVAKVPVTARVRRLVELVPRELTLPRVSGSGPVYAAACICRAPAAKAFTLAVEEAPPDVEVRIRDQPENPSLKFVEIDGTRLKAKVPPAGLVTRVSLIAEADGKRISLVLTLSVGPPTMAVKEAVP